MAAGWRGDGDLKMCIPTGVMEGLKAGAGLFQMVGQLQEGQSRQAYHEAQASFAIADAAGERDVADQTADRILRATAKRRSEARAATAGSGARIDAFSQRVEDEIQTAGETDAAMSILTGARKARVLERGGQMQQAAGQNAVTESLLNATRTGLNWKGAKKAVEPERKSFNGYEDEDF
jgi:hypothetical protein